MTQTKGWHLSIFDAYLKNYSMISTDALQVGFLSSLTIVNEGVVVNDR